MTGAGGFSHDSSAGKGPGLCRVFDSVRAIIDGVQPGPALRRARRRAGLTQRGLAARTGVAQPTIARIERGLDDPRVRTLSRLLQACGETLEVSPTLGVG